MHYTKYRGHETELTKKAIERGADIIAVCGGNGTVFGALQALMGSDIPLAIIPTGAGNIFSFNFGIRTRKEALEAIQNGYVNKVDAGKVQNEQLGVKYFLCYAGLGISSLLAKKLIHKPFRNFNHYFISLLRNIYAIKKPRVQLKINQIRELDILPDEFFIGNVNTYGKHAKYIPHASVTDGLLDVIIYNDLNVFRTLAFLLLSNFGIYDNKNDFSSYYKADQLSLFFANETDFQIDFEPFLLKGSVDIEIVKKAVAVYLPVNLSEMKKAK